jgi:phospholipid N-methyltransferase
MTKRNIFLFFCFFQLFVVQGCKQKEHKKVSFSCLSDTEGYRAFCTDSLNSPEAWETFKQHPMFHLFYDFCTYDEGAEYLNRIQKGLSQFQSLKTAFQENDSVGAPKLFSYGKEDVFSSSTLSYMRTFMDLSQRIGCLDELRILEIGGGYGGLCKVLSVQNEWKEYAILDFPHSLALSNKYLKAFKVDSVCFQSILESKEAAYDLVISHFGFSELDRKLQKEILEKILKNTQRGYLLCSQFPKHFRVDALSPEELQQEFARAGIAVDEWTFLHESTKGDYLIYWEKEKNKKTKS